MPPQQSLLKSNFMGLPDYWNDDDKTNYELLVADAKRYFPYMDDYIIHIGVIAEINRKLGKGEEPNPEKANELMEKYKNDNLIYTTPYDPDFDFKSTLLEVISPSGHSEGISPQEKISMDSIEE